VGGHFYLEKERLTPQKLLGTLIAFAGVAALFADRLTIDASQTRPMAAILGAALCGTSALLATKRYGGTLHPAALNATAMLIGAALLMLTALAAGEQLRFPSDR